MNENDLKYWRLIETTQTGFVILDGQGNVLDANLLYVKLTGHTDLKEILGRNVVEWTAPYERERNLAAVQKCFAEGFIQNFEVDYIDADGKTTPIEINASVVSDNDGTQILTLCRDITERRREKLELERSLALTQDSQRMLQSIIEAIPMRVFWKDQNLTYLGCNRLFARDAGFNFPEEIIGKDDFSMGWAGQAELYRADDRLVMETNAAKFNYEEPQTTPDGAQIWLRTSKVPLYDSRNAVMGILGIYTDITDYKHIEVDLRESESRFRALMEQSPIATQIHDREGFLIDANPIWEEMWQTKKESALGRFNMLNDPQLETMGIVDAARKAYAGETAFMPEFVFDPVASGFSGRKRYLTGRIYPIRGETGEVKGVVVLTEDVTERRSVAMEREALQRQIIAAQGQALKELSTPIIPIMEQILVMPLVGHIDNHRAKDLTRALLQGISQYRAREVILDITGVPLVDSEVAFHLNKTIQAARLKGVHTILTGISDAVAEAIVDLGIDWSGIETLRDLQSGLVLALANVGLQLAPKLGTGEGARSSRGAK